MDTSEQERNGTGRQTLALIEWLDRDGRVLRAERVHAWPVRLGRSLRCEVVVDDPHVAAEHAVLDARGSGVHVQLGPSINGAALGGRHLGAGQGGELAAGELLRVGTTRLRVRLADEPLAPELPLSAHALEQALPHRHVPASWPALAALVGLVLALLVGEQWLESNPGTAFSAYLTRTLGTGAGIGGWALIWALVSKLFRGRIDYLAHLRTVLRYLLAWTLVTSVLPAAAFATGWPLLSRLTELVGPAVLAAMLLAHLRLVTGSRRPALAVAVVALYAAGMGLSMWSTHQNQGRWFSELYVSTLLPPSMRLAPAQPPAALLNDVRGLQGGLDALARESSERDRPDYYDAE